MLLQANAKNKLIVIFELIFVPDRLHTNGELGSEFYGFGNDFAD